jgi:predicted GNAT family acetyltransferase
VALRLERRSDATAFLALAGDWLVEREAEHNLILGILGALVETPPAAEDEPPDLACVLDGRDRVVGVTVRTLPTRAALSEVDDPDAIELLAAGLAERTPGLTGLVGPAGSAEPLARGIAARLGRETRLGMSERAFRLREVIPPRPVSGDARLAGPDDRDLVLAWLHAFEAEAIRDSRVDEGPDPGFLARVDRSLRHDGSRRLWLWDDDGPVSLTGVSGPTPHGIRIGPVYTPPGRRGRGYASACVAAASQAALDGGRTFTFPFTDVANPTSNHIYQALGYEPVRDMEEWVLVGGGSNPAQTSTGSAG